MAKQLKACDQRRRAQVPVLAAADNGMSDWKRHLADMRRADRGEIKHPAQQWRHTYAVAPPHIDAYERAAARYHPPRC